MFPFTIDGTVRQTLNRPIAASVIVEALRVGLEDVRASRIWDRDSGLDFEVNMFRWWTTDFNLLASIKRGAIDIVSDGTAITVHYRLWVRLSLFIPLFFVPAALLMQPTRPGIALIALVILGVPYALTALRFRYFVRRVLG